MADIVIEALNMVDSNLEIGATDYAPGASGIRLQLDTPVGVWRGLRKGSRIAVAGDISGNLVIAGLQDMETAAGLLRYSLTNHGTEQTVRLELDSTGTQEFNLTVLVTAPDVVGGDVGATTPATSTWTWPIVSAIAPEAVI